MLRARSETQTRFAPSAEHLFVDLQEMLNQMADEAILRHGVFNLVLSGGRTPEFIYERLELEWPYVRLFFADERCLDPTHSASNYNMVKRTLLDRVHLNPEHVFRMKAEQIDGAFAYAKLLQKEESLHDSGSIIPVFDAVLLGMGEDGHTASIFEESPALRDFRCLVRKVQPGPQADPPVERMTLCLSVLNASRNRILVFCGPEKIRAARTYLTRACNPVRPVSCLQRKNLYVFYTPEPVKADG